MILYTTMPQEIVFAGQAEQTNLRQIDVNGVPPPRRNERGRSESGSGLKHKSDGFFKAGDGSGPNAQTDIL